jgi:hypothetical protein
MFMLALGLMAACVGIELIIVYKVPAFAELLENNTLLAVAFSFGLSWMLGFMLGAAGLIVMFAGVGSTVITAIIYKMHILDGLHWIFDPKERP